MESPRLAGLSLDTSPSTLQLVSSPENLTRPTYPPSPQQRSRWSPVTPSASTPSTGLARRLSRSLSNAISPISARLHWRRSQPIPSTLPNINESSVKMVEPLLRDTHSPLDRFRRAGHQVIQINRLRKAMLAPDDQGLDIRKPPVFGPRKGPCIIDVVDYGIAHQTSVRLKNADLEAFLGKLHRPSRKQVRWINVSGVSWDVVSTLATRHDLHPLSIDDMFGDKKIAATKADYYPQHIFFRLLCHFHRRTHDRHEVHLSSHGQEVGHLTISGSLECQEHEETKENGSQAVRSLASLGLFGAQLLGHNPLLDSAWASEVFPGLGPLDIRKKQNQFYGWFTMLSPEEKEHAKNLALVEALKRSRRVSVSKQHIYIFLRRDGTVLSFHDRTLDGFFDPVAHRLKKSRSTLRLHPDGSLLVHALLDRIVEETASLTNAFRSQMLQFERDVLINPQKQSTMRDLHIASGDLRLLVSSLKPMKTVIRTIRRSDVDKCIALAEDQGYVLENKKAVQGYMSHQAKMYLADVEDNLGHVLYSLMHVSETADSLLRLAFDMTSSGSNSTMKTYLLFLVGFTPMIILSGYFGMNFQDMPSVQKHTEAFYWEIAVPFLVAIFCFLSYHLRWWNWFRGFSS